MAIALAAKAIAFLDVLGLLYGDAVAGVDVDCYVSSSSSRRFPCFLPQAVAGLRLERSFADAIETRGPEAVEVLGALIASTETPAVRLQAVNALTYVPDARPALAPIQAAAQDDQQYVRDSSRYLAAVLDGSYDPGKPLFDLERMRRGMKGGG